MAKKYGDNSVYNLAEGAERLALDFIPTGSIHLDEAVGGGIPRGRIIEIYGPQSSGKTTLALSIIAQAQKMGGVCAFIDVEQTADAEYMEACGIDRARLYFSQPDSAEQALSIAEDMIRTGLFTAVVLDSIAALVPQEEVSGEMGEFRPGGIAKLMSQACRKLTAPCKRSNTAMIFINQLREKIGVMYGNPETTPGGKAMGFFATLRLVVRRGEVTKVGDRPEHVVAKVRVEKSKISTPLVNIEFDIVYGKGINPTGGVLSLATEKGLVQRAGAFYKYKGETIGQGREAAIEFLESNAAISGEIEAALRDLMGRMPAKLPVDVEDPAESY